MTTIVTCAACGGVEVPAQEDFRGVYASDQEDLPTIGKEAPWLCYGCASMAARLYLNAVAEAETVQSSLALAVHNESSDEYDEATRQQMAAEDHQAHEASKAWDALHPRKENEAERTVPIAPHQSGRGDEEEGLPW